MSDSLNRPGNGRTVYVETYGCQMNTYDSQFIVGQLTAAGYTAVDDHMKADVVLLNTCSVREHAEHKVISRVGELRRMREKAEVEPVLLGICGCMAERLQDDLTRQKNRIDLVVGVDRYEELPALVDGLFDTVVAKPEVAVGHDGSVHYVAPPAAYPTNNSHLVTIHKGCDYRCTYCIVPHTRGPQREKAPDLIEAEIRKIVAAGGREVTLLGQNVTAYRWVDQLDFAGLLERVAGIDGLDRIRFLTSHPHDMHPHLMDVIGREEKVCSWLHVPPQSGSDRILRRMKRYYKRADFLEMVHYARQFIPDVTLSGDVIVGFPGETEDDFIQTLSLIEEVRFDTLFAFKYSERPGVPAAKMLDDVTTDEKKSRLARLLAVQETVWSGLADTVIGEVWTAIVEEPARRPEGSWRLRTANNRKIVVPLADGAPGQMRRIRINGWQNTSFHGTVSDE